VRGNIKPQAEDGKKILRRIRASGGGRVFFWQTTRNICSLVFGV
jgi:hypothetical protein